MSNSILPVEPTEKTSSPQIQSQPQHGAVSISRRNMVTLAAAGVFFAFFLPWMNILGANVTGLDVQKNFASYKLVWLMPALAAITLGMNMAGSNTDTIRRIAGVTPLVILGYAMNQIGTDFIKAIQWGGWLGLVAGLVLMGIPNNPKSSAKA